MTTDSKSPDSSLHNSLPSQPPSSVRQPLKPLDEALAQLLAHATPPSRSESVSTFDADGRVLVQDLLAGLNVPAADNSAMDGFAVRTSDWQSSESVFSIDQRIAAGSIGSQLGAGSAARIFTGAPIPAGADAVVMQEDCNVEGATLRLANQPKPGQCIRQRGEDVRVGSSVLCKGERLAPASLGLAASIGFVQLPVSPRIRVALFSTGDELVMPGDVAPADMKPGAIYNSNRFFLNALLRRLGAEVTDLGIVPDKLDATVSALRDAAAQHDMILTSGGVSVGEEDHIKPAVQALGQLDLWQIAIKPGKPFAHGRIDTPVRTEFVEAGAGPATHRQAQDRLSSGRTGFCHFIGLPGNPVSSFVTFVLLVRPFLLQLQGQADVALKTVAMRADFAWPKADRRREFLRVQRNAAGGLDLFPNQSSGVLTSAVWGDGVVDNPSGQTIAAGDTVQFLSFAELLS